MTALPNQALERTALNVPFRMLANIFAVAQFGSLGAHTTRHEIRFNLLLRSHVSCI